MTTINAYLTFKGNCREAFEFYKSVFGGEFSYVGTFAEMPTQDGLPAVPDEMRDQIMHISLPISKETTLQGSDTGGEWAPAFRQGNNFSLSISTDTKQHADDYFEKLSQDGRITMPLAQTFWGDYFGSIEDKFGVNWMVSFNEQRKEALAD